MKYRGRITAPHRQNTPAVLSTVLFGTLGLKVCSCCPGPVRNGSSVASYCAARPALELQGRCCLSREPEPGVIVGLDLGNCSLTFLCAGFPDANTALVM
ncbi:all-trans retinoic acid-induced differentiation factor-like isoform X3 [Mauremys mutica]|uniref:all-trans retinoic acid-induced differentiation factor-like isoform X3 n=1 Tax=Mauremys mutica TaxID=74926 RepID=UPI001D1683C4|nr:all-trans retinoic acid-induced differentiation factor-like isoform X3 [Mauremys mutica]XP_044867160.1 all-trans retinoic acid-induced differentiation factor-like isoform X3 [Mauremys mutica]